MNNFVKLVRGTHDLLPDDCREILSIAQIIRDTVYLYGFEFIETPIFEFTEVFNIVGVDSDIIKKETYTFIDRGGESLTLRPEGTAPIARALASKGILEKLPIRLYYEGPMFRYDRPQKGRQRQFLQSGVEFFGEKNYLVDSEMISMADHVFKSLGLRNKVNLYINNLGDINSRYQYCLKLSEYFNKYSFDLSMESRERVKTNPLRILDSKSDKDLIIARGAPDIDNFLTIESKKYFDNICHVLEDLNITYTFFQTKY